jgi:hypothetical protein
LTDNGRPRRIARAATADQDLDGSALRAEIEVSTSLLLWGVLFSSIGLGFLVYGKQQKAAIPLLCGFALMVYPYFVANTYILVVIGIGLTAIPYFVRL